MKKLDLGAEPILWRAQEFQDFLVASCRNLTARGAWDLEVVVKLGSHPESQYRGTVDVVRSSDGVAELDAVQMAAALLITLDAGASAGVLEVVESDDAPPAPEVVH